MTDVVASRLTASYRATRIWQSRQPGHDIGSFTMLRFGDPRDPTPASTTLSVFGSSRSRSAIIEVAPRNRSGEAGGILLLVGVAARQCQAAFCNEVLPVRSSLSERIATLMIDLATRNWQSSAGDSYRRPSDQATNLVFLSRQNFPTCARLVGVPVCAGIERATSPIASVYAKLRDGLSA